MGKRLSNQENYFTATLRIRCPAAMPEMIERAAVKHMMLSSEYVRQAVLKQLRLDGIEPEAMSDREREQETEVQRMFKEMWAVA